MSKIKRKFFILLIAALAMILSSCSGSGSGTGPADSTSAAGTTTISGKVALSSISSSSSKPAPALAKSYAASKSTMQKRKAGMDMQSILFGKTTNLTGGPSLMKALTSDRTALADTFEQEFILSGAVVQIFDAERPEFIYPIAEALSDENGNYILNDRRYADSNNPLAINATSRYTNGSAIPAGRYSLIASKFDANVGKLFVAVQSIVKSYEGPIQGNNLVAQDSDAIPEVLTMFAHIKEPISNLFGYYYDSNNNLKMVTVPKDSAIQVTFSQAMARLSVLDASKLIDNSTGLEVPGQWKVSANLLSAAFFPFNDMAVGTIYKLSINGGKSTESKQTAKNVFGRPIPSDVTGYFMASQADPARPKGFSIRPSQSINFDDVKDEGGEFRTRVTAPIRIETDKPLDTNYFDITVEPSIGEMPTVLYLGSYVNPATGLDRYIYDIIPSEPLKLQANYYFTVDGARDLEGLPIIPFSFDFVTEAFTNGVDPAASAIIQQTQAEAKDIFGKWLRAFSDKNITMLTNYMTGDFIWLTDTNNGNSEDDLNRDGRLSAYEFSLMLEKWFKLLKACDSKVTGDVVGTIIVNSTTTSQPTESLDYNRARMTFTLDVTSENYSNPQCQETGPPGNLYVELKRINGAWYVSRGADQPPLGGTLLQIRPVRNIEIESPTEGEELTLPFSGELRPAFKWTGIANVTTYAVVLIDARSPWLGTGWVALVNGIGTENLPMKVNFTPKPGAIGDVYITDASRINWFRKNLTSIKSGGRYIWAVLGFDTLTTDEMRFRIFSDTRNMSTDLLGSSQARAFSVEGSWLEMGVKVKNILNKEYAYDQFLGGYDLVDDAIDIARLEIYTPSGAINGTMRQYGFGEREQILTFTNGYATSSGNMYVDVPLYYGRNEFLICDGELYMEEMANDWTCDGLRKDFVIMTSGGEPPILEITSLIDNATDASVGTPDSWGSIYNETVQYIDITAKLNGTHDNGDWLDTNVSVWSDSNFSYYDYAGYPSWWTPNTDRQISFVNVPVVSGWNSLEINASYWDTTTMEWMWFSSRVNIEVGPNGGIDVTQTSNSTVALPGNTLLTDSWEGSGMPLYHTGPVNTTTPVDVTVDTSTTYCYDYGLSAGKEVCGYIVYGYLESYDSPSITFDAYIFNDTTWGVLDTSFWPPTILTNGTMAELPDLGLYRGLSFVTVSLNEDNQSQAALAFSDNNNIYVPPLSLNVDVLLPTSGTLRLNWSSSNYSDYSSSDVDSIRVTGIAADIANGSIIANGVSYDHSTSGVTTRVFADVAGDGSFSFDINLAHEWNDIRISTCEDDGDPTVCASLNNYNLYVYTEAGSTPPKYISIDSPTHNSEVLVNMPLTVYGHIDNTIDGFVPSRYIAIWIDKYDADGIWAGGTSYYWYDDVYCGLCTDTMTYDPVTNYFYVTHNFDSAYATSVRAYTYGTTDFGAGSTQSHSHEIWVNNILGYGEYSYKPSLR